MIWIQYNDADFRARFAAFNYAVTYPEPTLQSYWNLAGDFINTRCSALSKNQLTSAMNLMTAHLTQLNTLAASGQSAGVMTSASIDKVSVTVQPPPEVNQWQWWCNQTPYGQQLLALLQVASVGGFYFGGFPTATDLRR